jgi:beta-N-acetylhexosaminidase
VTDVEKLSQNVGRLLLARIPGPELDERSRSMLADGTIGGAVLFRENATSLSQLRDLTAAIVKHSLHVPIITADQEGGAVQRFDHVLTPIPSAMALAACGQNESIASITRHGATQLKELGFNCLLSPVLDVLTNPLNPVIGTRAFSDSPRRVAEIGILIADAIAEGGLVPVGKHFPGHGSTLEDSHADLAVNPCDSKTLWQVDLVPFRSALSHLPAILIGHVWLSSVDPQPLPATLSSMVIDGILRHYLNYEGVIMSDDMIMKAITDRWGLPEACLMALEAGQDLLLVCGDQDQTVSVHEHLVNAVKSGRLSEERLNESIKRINNLFPRRSSVMAKKSLPKFADSVRTMRDHSLKVSCSAVTVLRGEIPRIDSGHWLVLAPNHARYPMRVEKYLREIAPVRFNTLSFSELRYSLDPSPEEAETVVRECSERNCIFLTYRSLNNQGQLLLGSLLAAEAREKIAVSTDTPFDLVGLPAWDNVVAIYDPSDLAMEALAKVLLGEFTAQGVCPVNLEFQVVRQAST